MILMNSFWYAWSIFFLFFLFTFLYLIFVIASTRTESLAATEPGAKYYNYRDNFIMQCIHTLYTVQKNNATSRLLLRDFLSNIGTP